jgi:hypothetical protein
MSKLIDVLINDKLITDTSLVEKARTILSNKSYEDLMNLVKQKHIMTYDVNEKYNKDVDEIINSNLESDMMDKKLNEVVLMYFMKRKEIENRFVEQLE